MITIKRHRPQLTNHYNRADIVTSDGEPRTIIRRNVVQSYTLRWRERRGKHHTIVVRTLGGREVL